MENPEIDAAWMAQIVPGFKFKSLWFKGETKVLEVKNDDNELEVEITPPTGSSWTETWDLTHTVHGFERGDYFLEPANAIKQ